MLARMRQQSWQGLRVEWGVVPIWQTALPANAFGSDTVIVCAGFASRPDHAPVRLLAAGADDQTVEIARGEASAPAAHDTVARMAASRRLGQLDEDAAQALAVDYQLLTERTNCVLVHRRAYTDKATEAAQLHQVHSMLAAGWGATATVAQACSFELAYAPHHGAASNCTAYFTDLDDEAIAFIAGESGEGVAESPEPTPLELLTDIVVEHLSHGGGLTGLAAQCSGFVLHDSLTRAIARAAAAGVEEDLFWLLLAQWVNDRDDGASAAWIDDLLAPFVATLDPGLVMAVRQILDDGLGCFALEAWQPTRSRRLREALGRSPRV